MKDFYAILEVPKTATGEEIKKSYRGLAKKYHPDLHPGDLQAETRFKEIGEAYAVLGDEEKRRQYDQSRNAANTAPRTGPGTSSKKTSKAPMNPDFDISNMTQGFESFFGFNPKTGDITNEEKLKREGGKKKNPLDMGDLFEKYMGFK